MYSSKVIKTIFLTVFVHASFETLLQSTGSALIPMCLIDGTLAVKICLCFASVDTIAMNTSLEKTRTTYKTNKNSVQFSFEFNDCKCA